MSKLDRFSNAELTGEDLDQVAGGFFWGCHRREDHCKPKKRECEPKPPPCRPKPRC